MFTTGWAHKYVVDYCANVMPAIREFVSKINQALSIRPGMPNRAINKYHVLSWDDSIWYIIWIKIWHIDKWVNIQKMI